MKYNVKDIKNHKKEAAVITTALALIGAAVITRYIINNKK